ncbi:putative Nudix hydrolase NudL [subsurface metagenome]
MNLPAALKEELSSELPGLKTQLKMAPENKSLRSIHTIDQNASVCIIILCGPGQNEILLTKRTTYNGHHSGQVSLPGGKEEPNDTSLVQTAIRESYEEIGIILSLENFLGKLTPLYVPLSQIMVHPFVFYYPFTEKIHFNLDNQEVDYILYCSLKALQDKNLVRKKKISIDNYSFTIPYYAIEGETVWGATAMILSEFIEILRRIERKNTGISF